jgi:hypothetical protein
VEKLEQLCALTVWKTWNYSVYSLYGKIGTAVWKYWNCSVHSLCGKIVTVLCSRCETAVKAHSISYAISATGSFPQGKAAGA